MKTREELWAIAQPMIDEWVKDPDLSWLPSPAEYVYCGVAEDCEDCTDCCIYENDDISVSLQLSFKGDAHATPDDYWQPGDAWWTNVELTIDVCCIDDDSSEGYQHIEFDVGKKIWIGEL